ncbi:MAG: hypothetical protein JXA74_03555 [Anaerolineae bacterium]|nr:hypothetical protein [Anaerolineae bacterium]
MRDLTALLIVAILVILLGLEGLLFLRPAPESGLGANPGRCAPPAALETRLAREPVALHTASVREATACCATPVPAIETLLADYPREVTRDPRVATALAQDACLAAVEESARVRRTLTGSAPTPGPSVTSLTP